MERKLNLIGWVMFVVCAGFFIFSAIKAADMWYLTGSLIFLVGCILFIIPLVKKM